MIRALALPVIVEAERVHDLFLHGIVEFRQNLTSVVEDGEYNPWGRWWWGAAPLNAREQTYIDRSGLCLTEEGFLVYFWGDSLGRTRSGKRCSGRAASAASTWT